MTPSIVARIDLLRGLALVALAAAGCRGGPEATDSASPGPVPATSMTEPSPAMRVMPLGDSITQADASHDSYRRPLWKILESEGYDVDFVGSQSSNHRGGPPHRDFDTDHEGHWGWRVDEILERLPSWMEDHQPDVLLVHLGSNDIFEGQSIESTLEELSELIDAVRRARPRATFLLAQILPTTTAAINERIRELNRRIPDLASEKTSRASPVKVVDLESGFDPARQTYDGVHPNADGEIHMAERFFDALEEVLP